MSTYTTKQLQEIVRKHGAWLRDEEGGERANLRDANLYGADLYGANLYGADLYGANLSVAGLRYANLSGANLRYANLSGANLRDANLYGADLYGANLYDADLYGANLRDANLSGANLRYANLYGADLYGANLYGADLYGANLSVADLRYANLRDANLYGADLSGANLYGANLSVANNLSVATVSWNSHSLLSEILYRASGQDLGRQALAALIGRNVGWCWETWLSDDAPGGVDQDDWLGIVVDHRPWALSELAKWVKDGDDAPGALRQYVAKEQPA